MSFLALRGPDDEPVPIGDPDDDDYEDDEDDEEEEEEEEDDGQARRAVSASVRLRFSPAPV